MTERLRAGVLGASGFAGGELLRLLLDHPQVELAGAASSSRAGDPVHAAHPHLRGRTTLCFQDSLDPKGLGCVFLAGAHGEAMEQVPDLLRRGGEGLRLIDLSGDFRLRDAALYPRWYGRPHASAALLPSFVYGLPEVAREKLRGAGRVANPGCLATAAALALAPLARAGWKGTARVTAVTGSSGSGARPSETTHHPTRDGNMRAYKPLRHQHSPEVEQVLAEAAGHGAPEPRGDSTEGDSPPLRVALAAVSGPFVRGIYCLCHLESPRGATASEIRRLFEEAYAGCPFIRLLDSPPELNAVRGGNYCDLHAAVEGDQVLVITALDNLVKGAAGQAVQNLNLMMGWEETAGLTFPGLYP